MGNIKSIVSIAGVTARPLFFEVVMEWLFFIFGERVVLVRARTEKQRKDQSV